MIYSSDIVDFYNRFVVKELFASKLEGGKRLESRCNGG